ncbi:DUF881 domain-containing protein [Cellulomonas sp. P5_E12]
MHDERDEADVRRPAPDDDASSVQPPVRDDDAPSPDHDELAPADDASDLRDPERGPKVFVPDLDPAVDDEPDRPVAKEAPSATSPLSETGTVEPESPERAGEPQPAPSDPPSGWVVLGRALRPRMNRAQVLAGVLCAVLGFALVAQVRQSSGADLAGMRQGDLVRILDETTNRGDALARESADLARERDDLLSGSDRRQAALDALRRSAETQGILTGRLPAEGPGVTVTLTEPDGLIKPITMLNMLEELRNAGAEAVQLNDRRVTASSSFTGTGGAVVLDGVALTAPYRWIAIGDPDIIAPALQIPGGAMAQVRNNGGRGTVDSADKVVVDAIRDVPDPRYATPVPPEGD